MKVRPLGRSILVRITGFRKNDYDKDEPFRAVVLRLGPDANVDTSYQAATEWFERKKTGKDNGEDTETTTTAQFSTRCAANSLGFISVEFLTVEPHRLRNRLR